jgi:hypothetical protein
MSSNLYCSQDATAGPAIRADVSNNRMQSFANRPANKVTLILVAVKSCQNIALLHDLCRIVFGEQCHTRLFQLRRGCAPKRYPDGISKTSVIPAKAGIHFDLQSQWIPAQLPK